MTKLFKRSAKSLMPLVLVCLFALNATAAAPGFSNGEVSQTVNTGALAEAIVSAITVDSAVVEAVSNVVASAVAANPGATVSEIAASAVATVAADGGDVAAIASEIVAAVIAETKGADVITVITDVVSAITAASGAGVSEVLTTIISSIPPEVLADLSVDFVTEQGVGLDMPATTFLSTLIEQGITELTFAANTVSEESTTYQSAMDAAKESSNDLGVDIEVNEVLDLNLLDQNNKKISKLGGEVTVSLPAKGKSNAGAYFDETNGKILILPSRAKNGFIEFKTNHFSHYMLIEAPASVIPDFSTVLPPATNEPVVVAPSVPTPPVSEPSTSDASAPTPSETTVSEPSGIIFIDEPAVAGENTDESADEKAPAAPAEPVKANPRTGSWSVIIFVSAIIAAATGMFFAIRAKRAKSL